MSGGRSTGGELRRRGGGEVKEGVGGRDEMTIGSLWSASELQCRS
jgi:hypothetical protein